MQKLFITCAPANGSLQLYGLLCTSQVSRERGRERERDRDKLHNLSDYIAFKRELCCKAKNISR